MGKPVDNAAERRSQMLYYRVTLSGKNRRSLQPSDCVIVGTPSDSLGMRLLNCCAEGIRERVDAVYPVRIDTHHQFKG